MTRYFTLFIGLLLSVVLHAQRFVAEAPSQVSVGEQFRVTYTINTQNANGFRTGSFPDAMEVLMGPSTSVQSSYQMVNGHTSSSSSITYTYIVCANKNGTFKLPSAHVSVGGKSVASNDMRIRVSGQGRTNSGASQQQSGGSQRQMRAAGSHISSRDLFIKVSANKNRVHEQEPVLLTYKVYTLVDLTQLEGKMPDLKGFHTQEVQLPQQKSFKIERYKGLPYRTVTWSQYVMFPQITGKLTIPSIMFNGIIVQENRSVDPFEAFFNGGSGYVEVKKQIKAPGLTIQVDPLPKRPANFSGGVGRFNISAQPNKTETRANDPITLRVIVSGIGNLKLIKEPVVNFPKDFDKYDAKVTDKTKLSSNGVEGSMIYDFLVVPRHQGSFDIPPITFTYYDTQSNAYKTISAAGFKLNVSKGSGKGSSVSDYTGQEDIQELNSDIRFIKLGDSDVHDVNDIYFDSLGYWITLILLALGFISLLVIFRQRAIDNANVGKMRGKKANKIATRRLKKAGKLMAAVKPSEFYDEVLRALWGYVGDKLNMRIEQLSRDNISQNLAQRDVDEATVNLFIQALDECEFERYAPGDEKGNMNKTFNAAMTAIMKIEEAMRQHKKQASQVGMVVLILMLLPLSSHAITKENADSAYARQQYQQAIKDYQELLHTGVNADLYYNLGNAYYRMDNITRAVLNYERALLLAPGDRDIRFNLQIARNKTIDKITPESEMFFVTWYRSLVNLTNTDGWAVVSLVALALGIALVLLYLFANKIWLRKVGFFGGAFTVLLFLLSSIFAYQQHLSLTNRKGAIIISSAVQIKSTPAKNGTDLFILHEGTKVEIVDGTMNNWKKVVVADGKEGWLETSNIEII